MVHALRLTGLLAAAALAVVPPSAGIAQVLMQRDVSLKMALTIAEAAVGACEKAGNNVSVAVIDRAGRLRVFLQGDKAAPHNIELAQRKAYTARTFGRTSAEWERAPSRAPNSRGNVSSNMSSHCGAACRSRSATRPSAPSG